MPFVGLRLGLGTKRAGGVSAPVATAATGVGQTSFTANWNAYTGATYYLLDVSASPTFNTFIYENQQVNAPTTSYVVIGLEPNTTYYYRVRASTEALTDPDYQAILDYATTQGYTLPTSAQQVLQNQLLVDLKDAGIWSKLDTFAVFATDGNSDFALIDWKRLSQYTAVNSPTFTSNQGFTGNGTSSYINTNYNPTINGVNFSQNSASMGGYQFNSSTDANCDFGALQTTPATLRCHFPANGGIGINTSSFLVSTGREISNGVFSLIRDNSSSFDYYRNSSKTPLNTVGTSSGIVNLDLFGLARNVQTTANQFSPDTLSVLYAGDEITTEYSDFVDSIDNYISSL